MRRPFYLRVRSKLAIALALATLLPLGAIYIVGLGETVKALEHSLARRSQELAGIARNVLLRQVQSINRYTDRLAADPELARLLGASGPMLSRYLESAYGLTLPGLVEVYVPGPLRVTALGPASTAGSSAPHHAPPGNLAIARGLAFERHITLEHSGGLLVVRSAAPVLSVDFQVVGVVLTTVPLDAHLAELIKGVVQAEVGFLAGLEPTISTYTRSGGKAPGPTSLAGVGVPPGELRRLLAKEVAVARVTVDGRHYQAAFAPLQSASGRYLGAVSVGLSRDHVGAARRSAILYLGLGSAGGLSLVWFLAWLLGRNMTRPLARLHRIARAVEQGDLEQSIAAESDDEIGDLARGLQNMIEALRQHQERERSQQQHLEHEVERRTRELARANERLEELARTDGLTGLANHRHFKEQLEREVERCRRTRLPLSLLMIDVDNFKHYNDVNGHPAGDVALKEVASVLSSGRRVNDVVARYGGEEFAVLLVDTPEASAIALADQLRRHVEAAPVHNESCQPGGRLTVSLGVATFPDHATVPEDLLTAADDALYRAKGRGRNRVVSVVKKKNEEQ